MDKNRTLNTQKLLIFLKKEGNMTDLRVRILEIKAMLTDGTIDEAQCSTMCNAAAGAPLPTGGGGGPGGRQPHPPNVAGDTIVTQETQQAKALRELKTHVESFLGTMNDIKINKVILDFTLNPQNTSAFAKARLENLFRELGLAPTGQGCQLMLILKGATPGTTITALVGDAPAFALARAMVWDHMCRVLAIYAVCQQERLSGKALSPKERQNMEDTYVSKVLKPQEAGEGGHETARVFLNALGWFQKQEEVTHTTLKREGTETENTPKAPRINQNGNRSPQGTKPVAGGYGTTTPQKGGPMPTVKDIPPDFKNWKDFKEKLAWARPHGLCIPCLEAGKIKVGITAEHKNH